MTRFALYIIMLAGVAMGNVSIRLVMYADALMHVSRTMYTDPRDNEAYRVFAIEYVSGSSPIYSSRIDTLYVFAENLRYVIPGSIAKKLPTGETVRYYSKDAALHACPTGWHVASAENMGTFIRTIDGNDTMYVGTELQLRKKELSDRSLYESGRKLAMYEQLVDSPTGWYDEIVHSLHGVDTVAAMWSFINVPNDHGVLEPTMLMFDNMTEPKTYPDNSAWLSVRCVRTSNNSADIFSIPLFSQDIMDKSFRHISR